MYNCVRSFDFAYFSIGYLEWTNLVRSTRFLDGHSNDIMSWGDSNVIWVMLFTDFQDFLNTGNFNVLLKLWVVFMHLISPRHFGSTCTKLENEWLCIYVLGVSILSLSKIFRLDIWTIPTIWYILFLIWFIKAVNFNSTKWRGEIKCMKTNHYDRIIICHGKGLEKSLAFNLIWSHSKRCNLILNFKFCL
jgi:hypothetical protein